MSDFKNNKLLKISNSSCVLFEYVNLRDTDGHNLLQVGFCCWLECADDFDFDKAISEKKEVIINWPENVTVTSATSKSLRNALKKAKFKKFSVRLLRHGDWDTCMEKQKNLMLFDITTPTKEDRVNLKKKVDEDYVYTNKKPKVTNIVKVKKTLADPVKKAKVLIEQLKQERLKNKDDSNVSTIISDINQSSVKENDSLNSDTVVDRINEEQMDHDIHTQPRENAFNDENESKVSSDLNEYGSDDGYDKELQDCYEKINIQKDEIATLEEEVKILRANDTFSKQKIVKLEKQLEYARSQNGQNANNEVVCKALMNIQNLISKELTKYQGMDEHNSRVNKSRSSQNDTLTDPSIETVSQNEHVKTKRGGHVNKETTNYKISSDIMSGVRRDSVNNFTNDIIDQLFTREELSKCSVTGKPCNANKNMPVRPALSPNRLHAARSYKKIIHLRIIIDACAKYFGHKRGWKSCFNQTAGNKCNDARRSSHSSH